MKGFLHDDSIFSIPFYAVVLAAMLPTLQIYRQTPLGILLLAGLWFVVFVPMLSLAAISRSSREWPTRLFKWHLIACACLLGLSLVGLIAHGLWGVGGVPRVGGMPHG